MANIKGTVSLEGVAKSNSSISIVDQPQFSARWYTNYPNRHAINGTYSSPPNADAGDNLYASYTYIVDVKLENGVPGTAISYVNCDLGRTPNGGGVLGLTGLVNPTVTPMDTVTNSAGICRFKVVFPPCNPKWEGHYYASTFVLNFSTDGGEATIPKVSVLDWTGIGTPDPGELNAPPGDIWGFVSVLPGDYVDIAMVGGGGGGGSRVGNTYDNGSTGSSGDVRLFMGNFINTGSNVWSLSAQVLSATGGAVDLLGMRATGFGGIVWLPSESDGQPNLDEHILWLNNSLYSISVQLLSYSNGNPGTTSAGGTPPLSDPAGTMPDRGAGGKGHNTWGGGSGAQFTVRIRYRRIGNSNIPLPVLRVGATGSNLILGGGGGTTSSGNGLNGKRGLTFITAQGDI